jgi:hypothetical protein
MRLLPWAALRSDSEHLRLVDMSIFHGIVCRYLFLHIFLLSGFIFLRLVLTPTASFSSRHKENTKM